MVKIGSLAYDMGEWWVTDAEDAVSRHQTQDSALEEMRRLSVLAAQAEDRSTQGK
jgi:hypothetical protein